MREVVRGSRGIRAAILLIASALSVGSSVACRLGPRGQEYTPVLAGGSAPAAAAGRGTLQGDFAWAANSRTLAEARGRWEAFLRQHEPPDGEYEDAFAKYRVAAARLELMRVYYLLGQRAEGDRLLRALDPTGPSGTTGPRMAPESAL